VRSDKLASTEATLEQALAYVFAGIETIARQNN
jgi:hypothetical protein